MSLYPVNSCIIQSVSVLYFCCKTECTITTLCSEEQNTEPKYVTKCNVFCVTFSGFVFLFHNCKAGFSGQAEFLLAAWRHT